MPGSSTYQLGKNSCFYMIGPDGVIFCYYQKWFSFSLKVSVFQLRPSFLVWDIACLSFDTCFSSHFFFSSSFLSFDPSVVCIVSGGCYQSSSALFYLIYNFILMPVVSWLSLQEMDTATRAQNLDETDCISHSTNTLGKGINPIILPPAMGK